MTQVSDLGPDQLDKLYQTATRVLHQAITRKLMAEGPRSAFPMTG